jgi:hypothetical protein
MSIRPKKKICVECGTENYIFSKGRCKSCAQASYKGLSSTSTLKSNTPIKKITSRTRKAKKEQSKVRAVYFDYHINKCTQSEESGKPISEANRANICHIFDKGRHKSVQANLDNFVYLTLEEHTRFDELLFALDFEALEKTFPNSWKIVCERVRELLPLVEEKTKLYFKFNEYLYE